MTRELSRYQRECLLDERAGAPGLSRAGKALPMQWIGRKFHAHRTVVSLVEYGYMAWREKRMRAVLTSEGHRVVEELSANGVACAER